MKSTLNEIIPVIVLIMMSYIQLKDISPFQPYNAAMEEKIEEYAEFVSQYRKSDIESFLSRIYGLSTQHCLDFDIVIRWLYTESRFNPRAVSPKGAIGICQLMPPTAQLVGSIIDYRRFNLRNEEDNLILGFAFLAMLLRDSDYDYEKALARYYAGSHWVYYLDSRYVKFIVQEELCETGI